MAALLAALEANPDADAVVGRTEYFGDISGLRLQLKQKPEIHAPMLLQSMLIRRRLFDRIGQFNESLSTSEDLDFFMRARRAGAVIRPVDVTSVRYRRHPGNISGNVSRIHANTLDVLGALSASRRKSR
jgi:GT2 family glycosyltransferase